MIPVALRATSLFPQGTKQTQCAPESGQCTLPPRRYDVGSWTMYVFKGDVNNWATVFPGNAQYICAQAPPARHEPDTAGDGMNWTERRHCRATGCYSAFRGDPMVSSDQQKRPLANMYSDDLICSSRNPED
ncbi:hypothetical protein Purlil1_12770 [Purpureocillium lilacinum]|uniref:Uncharacterized protein n=1 Tax=Purpureocillium lilacinum TaxID=33203 RepID=A0ABR0BFY4_PURLI|nr:hypothetical protein Purlil1_12770 [Purpureocillium lilacinum]